MELETKDRSTLMDLLHSKGVDGAASVLDTCELHPQQIVEAVDYYDTHRMRESWKSGALVSVLQKADVHADVTLLFPPLHRLKQQQSATAAEKKRQQWDDDRKASVSGYHEFCEEHGGKTLAEIFKERIANNG